MQNQHDTFEKDSTVYWSGATAQKSKAHATKGFYRVVERVSNDDGLTNQASWVIENDETDPLTVSGTELRHITEEERLTLYQDAEGSCCPFCLHQSIEGGSISIDGNNAVQEVWCNRCTAGWKDYYALQAIHKTA